MVLGVKIIPMKTKSEESLLIRKSELSRRLNVSIRTIDNWMASRKIRFIRIGGTILFNPVKVLEDLEKFEIETAFDSY
ncbi:MAG: hypothetical protein CMO55_23365 [Verrucomicrobiales bacterium]|nr:hypothetical protein [Verrucomicrobiales bacterium]